MSAFDQLTQFFMADFVQRYEDRNGAGSATDTVKQIIASNFSYCDNRKYYGCLGDTEIERWERLSKVFADHANREDARPLPGDRVLVKGKNGKVYKQAVISNFERVWDEKKQDADDNKDIVYICMQPSVHVSYEQETDLDNGLSLSVSGGYFNHVDASRLQLLDELCEANIWFWGNRPEANGGLYMKAKFKYWLLEGEEFY